MLSIQLTQSAESDLAHIAEYTLENFGLAQAEIYYQGLSSTLETLCQYPELGTHQDKIKTGLKRFVYQYHSIYFSHTERILLVYRILNHKQDPLRHRFEP
ncbi:MAG: type II toxin-antitoxin system RelE/ParE family toxin [Hydrogenovibrio sp.]